MDMKKTGIIALLVLVFTGAGFFWWNQGSAERSQEKMDIAVKYISDNNFEKAILAYNDAIKIDPKAIDAYQGLAKIYTLQGEYDKAASVYEQGLGSVSSEDQVILQLGLAGMYFDKGEMDQAEAAFQKLIENDPACLEAYWGLDMVYQQQGDNTKVEDLLYQAVDNNPDQYRAYNLLALYYSQNGLKDQAFQQVVNSLSIEFNQQEAYLILNQMFDNNWVELLVKSESVENIYVGGILNFYNYYGAKDYNLASEMYELGYSKQTDNHKAHILGAISLVKNGNPDRAAEVISQLASQDIDPWLLSDLAEYYLAAGDKQKARYTAIDALEAHSTNLEAVAILQRLNMNDETGKIYAAQYLLYNWKPISVTERDLNNNNLPIPKRNTDITGDVKLSDPKLVTAAADGDMKTVRDLLDQGVDPNVIDGVDTALMAASNNGHIEIVKLLIKRGADINLNNWQGFDALAYSVNNGTNDITKILLDAGANADRALFIAARDGNLGIVTMLLDAGADPNYKTARHKETPLHYAVRVPDGREIIMTLLKHGAIVDQIDMYGETPLGIAVGCDSTTNARILLENGADVNIKNSEGKPLMEAASNEEMRALLQSFGAQ